MLFLVLLILCCLVEVVPADHWPSGTYGIPKPESGCPTPASQWSSGFRKQVTEFGSIASENSHLAGSSDVADDQVVQEFCVKEDDDKDDDDTDDDSDDSDEKELDFMEGSYCLFKKGECPRHFSVGSIYWDDAAPFLGRTSQTYSGVLPDGVYNRNTKIFFCCRNDGSADLSIILPTSIPFYLLKFGDRCQKVAGMKVVEEWIQWANEKTVNLNSQKGSFPKMERVHGYNTKLFYCYYTQSTDEDWPTGIDLARSDMHGLRDIIVVAAYIIGGTVCFVLIIAIILTAIQRALLLRQARARACRDSGSRRQLVREHDSSRGPRSGGNVAADLPPSYDVVMCSPDQHAPRSAGVQPSGPVVSSASPAVTSPTSQLLTTDDVIRPPSYDDVLHQNISAK